MNVRELPAHQPSRLIVAPADKRQPSQMYMTDATSALTRGIAEYVAGLQLPSGAQAFASAYDAWAAPENLASYPGFVAYTNETPGEYEQASSMSPAVGAARNANGTYEVSSDALAIDIMCDIWATNDVERAQLAGLLEMAFRPVEWMAGFRLELPHYFNQRATYLPSRITYLGTALEARQGYVSARMIVRGAVPVTRVLPFAQAQAEIQVAVQAGPLPAPAPGTIQQSVDGPPVP